MKIIKKLKTKPFANFQWAYLVFLFPFFRVFKFAYDNDFWFTINQGRYVLEHTFPTIAINSIHNIEMIYQSWGTGTIFYLVYNHLGFYGILFLVISTCILTAYFFYKVCFTLSNNKRVSLYITILAIILYGSFITTRPHIFTVLNLTIMIYLLESYIKTDNSKYLYWLPLISLLQVNMHGIYFILLLIILSPYLINSFKFNFLNIKSDGYRKKPLFIAFFCMLLTGFINPYGYETIIYGFSSYDSTGMLNNTIVELLALNFHNLTGKLFIIVILITYVIYFGKKKNLPLRYYLLLFGTTYLAFDAVKSYYFFIVCSLLPLSYIFSECKKDIEKYKYSRLYHVFHCIFTFVIVVIIVLLIQKPKEPEITKYVDYLDEHVTNKEETKIFNGFMEGSYLEYRGYYCYIDPRAEIFLKSNNHKEDIYKEYNDLRSLKIDYQEFIDKYQFDYMLINKDDFLYYIMNKIDLHGYKKVLSDEDYMLLEKE